MSIADITSIIVAFFTALAALLLIWYSLETRWLRKTTEDMLKESRKQNANAQDLLEESQRQNANIEKQNENILLPILFPGEGGRNEWEKSNFLVIRNVGTGPAFNIEITPVHKTIEAISVSIAFKLASNSIAPGESQVMVIQLWINQTASDAASAKTLWEPLAHLDQTFAADTTIVCDSANGERHRTEFTLTVWPSLRFLFKSRSRIERGNPAEFASNLRRSDLTTPG